MRFFFHRAFYVIGNVFIRIANNLYLTPPKPKIEKEQPIDLLIERPVDLWFKEKGDKTHRINYDLNENSIVFDLGGYEGQWASDIFCKYNSNMLIFEPFIEYAIKIKDKFSNNSKISVFEFGLSRNDETKAFFVDNDRSSMFLSGEPNTHISLRNASSFLAEKKIQSVDLMKINIEGGEYDLLEHLIETGDIIKFQNIQVQFHEFIPNAKERMNFIQGELGKTHFLTYQYEFVWENWKIKDYDK